MRVGMNFLVWAAQVKPEHFPVMERLKAAGFDGVEIPLFTGEEADYRQLGQELQRLQLGSTAVTVATPEFNPVSPDSAQRRKAVERLKWCLDMCALMGSDVLCGPYHSPLGVFTGAGPTEDEKQRVVEVLRAGAEHAGKLNIKIALEFLCRFESYFLTTTQDAIDIARRVNHPALGLLYDTFHANIEEKDPPAAAARMGQRLYHVHISENDRGIPGTGHVPWTETFQALKRIKYDGWLTIEAFGRSMPEIAAATRVWRDLFPSAVEVYQQGGQFIRKMWRET
jgi:D-psicose/D-tagatose/L-ribulose 3-epimerase